jgi:hypothetical protein
MDAREVIGVRVRQTDRETDRQTDRQTDTLYDPSFINNIHKIIKTKVIRLKKCTKLLGCKQCEKVCNGLWDE